MTAAELHTLLGEVLDEKGDVEVYLPPEPGETLVKPCTDVEIGQPNQLREVRVERNIRQCLNDGIFLS